MKIRFLMAFALLLGATVAAGQQPAKPQFVAEDGAAEDRGGARVLYWDTKLDTSAGQFAIEYGRPEWKKEYEDPAKFDAMTKGKAWRMGKNFFTLLDTSLPLTISGKTVAPGYYYLGLRRSADGANWSLAFFDPAPLRAARSDGFLINKDKVAFEVPVKVEPSKEIAGRLAIALMYEEKAPTHVTFKLAWGNFTATAPIEVSLAK
jgi:hypothetical protein